MVIYKYNLGSLSEEYNIFNAAGTIAHIVCS